MLPRTLRELATGLVRSPEPRPRLDGAQYTEAPFAVKPPSGDLDGARRATPQRVSGSVRVGSQRGPQDTLARDAAPLTLSPADSTAPLPRWAPLRVALIIERFESGGGGLERAAWQTAHALARAGDEVTVVARRIEPGSADSTVSTVSLSVPEFWQPLRITRFASAAGRWLRQARREGRIDLAHAWSRVPDADVFHGGEGSHLHYMRRTYGRLGSALRLGSPRHIAQLALERRIFAAPGLHVQCVSSMVERELVERFHLPAARTHVIPYGVDLARFAPGEAGQRAALRAELGAGDATLLLLAGSGWRRKGLDTALHALAAMRDAKAQLWVAGRDDARPWRRLAARTGVEQRVRFLGARDDIERVYSACDVLLLPTRYDAFGMVCLEAAAAGLPVVTSAAAGAAELFADAGRVIDDPEDAAGFAAALDMLCDPAARKPLGERAAAIAAAHSWDEQTRQLRVLYRQAADRQPARSPA